MTRRLLVLRPEPGNAATIARARALGLEAEGFPLFAAQPVAWEAPDPAAFVGVMMTSANAARLAGAALERFTHLPLFAVGEATAEAARAVGFRSIVTGDGDVDRLLAKIATLGLHWLLHLSGEDVAPYNAVGISIDRQIVYQMHPAKTTARLHAALSDTPIVMIHSPRAGARLTEICPDRARIALIAISQNAADAAGPGWESVAIAAEPRDEAMLALAAMLTAKK